MGQLSIKKNGVEVMRLPPGFRFSPTDEEIILHYLRRKVFFLPLPAAVIPDFEVSRSDPWDLPGDAEQERYFFSTKDSNRTTPSGYWRATGIDKPVLSLHRRPVPQAVGVKRPLVVEPQRAVVGVKKTLVFYTGTSPNGTPTDWIMHEYQLATLPSLYLSGNAPLPNQLTQENWVLCRISRKMKGTNEINIGGEEEEDNKPTKKKCTGQGVLNEPASSGVSCDEYDDKEQCCSCDRDSDDESDDDSEEECCSCVCDNSEGEGCSCEDESP